MLFLGYYGEREEAAELATRLQAVGVELWCSAIDDDRKRGGAYHSEVFAELKRADCFLALVGRNGISGELLDELRRALNERGKRDAQHPYNIVPVALPSARRTTDNLLSDPPAEIEIFLPPVWLPEDWRRRDDDYFRRLAIRRLEQRLVVPVQPATDRPQVEQLEGKEQERPRGGEGDGSARNASPHTSPGAESRQRAGTGAAHVERALDEWKHTPHWAWIAGVLAAVIGAGFLGWKACAEPAKKDPVAGPTHVPTAPASWVSNRPACTSLWKFLRDQKQIDEPFASAFAIRCEQLRAWGTPASAGLPLGWNGLLAQQFDQYVTQTVGAEHRMDAASATIALLAEQFRRPEATLADLSSSVDDLYDFLGSNEPDPAEPTPPAGWSLECRACTTVWMFLKTAGETTAVFRQAHSVRIDQLAFWKPTATSDVRTIDAHELAANLSRYLVDARQVALAAGVDSEAALSSLTAVFLRPDGTVESLARKAGELYRFDGGDSAKARSSTSDPSKAGVLPLLMVRVPAGSFRMGDDGSSRDDEKPSHDVHVKPFDLSAFEVTRGQWREVKPALAVPPEWTEKNDDRLPANYVSWVDAVIFCNALSRRDGLRERYAIARDVVVMTAGSNGYRLPSEAEWEYACRAGTTTRYWRGDGEPDLDAVGWYSKNSAGSMHVVGDKPSNAFGLHDMHGNVLEWCQDTLHRDYRGAPDDGGAWVELDSRARVNRGGYFGSAAVSAQSAHRDWSEQSDRQNYLGFRPARSVAED